MKTVSGLTSGSQRVELAALDPGHAAQRTVHQLAEANAAIAGKLAWLNNRPFSKMDGTRALRFDQLDRPAMRPLPTHRYEYATWKTAKVNIDYHIDVGRHYYSVPYQLVGHRVDVRASEHTVDFDVWVASQST